MRKVPLKGMLVAGLLSVAAFAGLLSTPVVSAALIEHLQTFPTVSSAELTEAAASPGAAIVVLSAGRRNYAPEFGGETIDGLSLERVRYGGRLARQTGLPVLVSGGGTTNETMAPLATLLGEALLEDYGIRPKWLETQSMNTAENAMNSSALLKREGVTRVILVTHAWHMPRARASFIANGVSVLPAPTGFYRPNRMIGISQFVPSVTALHMSSYAIHEIVGRVWYAIRYGYR